MGQRGVDRPFRSPSYEPGVIIMNYFILEKKGESKAKKSIRFLVPRVSIFNFLLFCCYETIERVPMSISYQGYRQAPGVQFKGLHWIRCAENLTSRLEAGALAPNRPKLNIGKNMAAARPGSGVIHEPQSVTSDLQAVKRCRIAAQMAGSTGILPCCVMHVFNDFFSRRGINVCPVCEASLSHHILYLGNLVAVYTCITYFLFGKKKEITKQKKENKARHCNNFEADLLSETGNLIVTK